jgi:hypothetical protein
MRRGWLTVLTSVALAALLLAAPCKNLLASVGASEHACCGHSGNSSNDQSCQTRCAAVSTKSVSISPVWEFEGLVSAVAIAAALSPELTWQAGLFEFHSPPSSPAPLYLQHSSLLI